MLRKRMAELESAVRALSQDPTDEELRRAVCAKVQLLEYSLMAALRCHGTLITVKIINSILVLLDEAVEHLSEMEDKYFASVKARQLSMAEELNAIRDAESDQNPSKAVEMAGS